MTRDLKCVNTSCINFKCNCKSYPIVNTGVCSKATPRGVDRSVEPDYHQPHVGWKVSPVHNKLGENNSRPMGLASHKGVQTRISLTTLANKSNASDKLLIGGRGNDLYRSQRVTSQGCSDRDPTHPGRLCITNLLGREEGGGQRPVINLKALNMFVKHEHFKMEGLHVLPDLIQQEDWMIKLDLKDAYLQVPIHTEHQHLLQFQWEDKFY